jgi:hypothetical protein
MTCKEYCEKGSVNLVGDLGKRDFGVNSREINLLHTSQC